MDKESNHQFIHQLMSSLKRIQDHINEPEVIQSILDTIMPRDEELASILEPEEDDGPNEDSKNMAADIQAKLNKAATEEKINMTSGAAPTPTPRPLSSDDEWSDDYDKKHEGFEEQAAGLADLLSGLKEGPNDNRW